MSTREIAERLDVPYKTVWNALNPERARELSARSRERHREKRRAYDRERTRNLRTICETCGNPCGAGSANRNTKRCMPCRKAKRSARDDQIVAMYQEGMPLREIAARLGWARNGLSRYVARLRREGRIGYRYAKCEQKQKV